MLAKKTSKNQVTLPKKILEEIPDTDYFDVSLREGAVVLRPVTVTEPGSRLATIRRKIRDLGIEPKDIERAIRWARGRRGRRRRSAPSSLAIGSSLARRSRSPRRLRRHP